MNKKCRVCNKDAVWCLTAMGEFKRYYCSLTHLSFEVNEALETPYLTPDLDNENARFDREVKD